MPPPSSLSEGVSLADKHGFGQATSHCGHQIALDVQLCSLLPALLLNILLSLDHNVEHACYFWVQLYRALKSTQGLDLWYRKLQICDAAACLLVDGIHNLLVAHTAVQTTSVHCKDSQPGNQYGYSSGGIIAELCPNWLQSVSCLVSSCCRSMIHMYHNKYSLVAAGGALPAVLPLCSDCKPCQAIYRY